MRECNTVVKVIVMVLFIKISKGEQLEKIKRTVIKEQ